MRAYDLILAKRNGRELTASEINALIEGYMTGSIPDYQIAALLMAVYFKGMTEAEISALTMAMVNSGEQIDLSGIQGVKVDKHSTGGVGDKTTLVVGPLVAAVGVPVAKMSGRGLGHTGGTIDKLDSIPGFGTSLTRDQFIDNVNRIKISIGGQTGNLAPADKKLYALRDVTATVDCIPLIASSVMSKKIAAGADAIVLDVKAGSGAFMKSLDDAINLAKTMVQIGTHVGRNTVAVLTDMDQPLGSAIGNANEVAEAVQCLKGHGPADLAELSLALGSHMVHLAGGAESLSAARKLLEEALHDGRGMDKLKELVKNQGGDVSYIDNPDLLPKAREIIEVKANTDGYVARIEAEQIGLAAMTLGAGRETKDSDIDLAVGIRLLKKIGDRTAKNDTIALIEFNDESKAAAAKKLVLEAYEFTAEPKSPQKTVLGIVTAEGLTIY